jgi:hypothetical protein
MKATATATIVEATTGVDLGTINKHIENTRHTHTHREKKSRDFLFKLVAHSLILRQTREEEGHH